MSAIKYLLDEIANCNLCYGHGFIGYTLNNDFDFEYCECNPHQLSDPRQTA
jgi:hypothetical protein